MVNVRVLKPFVDLKARIDREPGDVFAATEERAAEIDERLPGFVSIEKPEDKKPEQPDYSKLTVVQLKGLCDERGLDVPKGAKKADIVAILEG